MNEQENTGIVRGAYDNFKQGDIQSVLGVMADDVAWRCPDVENMPHGGNRQGLEKVTEFFSILADAQEALRFEPKEFIADGERVAVLGSYLWRVKTTGKEFESDFVHVFTVRDGKVTSFEEFYDTSAAAAAYQKPQSLN